MLLLEVSLIYMKLPQGEYWFGTHLRAADSSWGSPRCHCRLVWVYFLYERLPSHCGLQKSFFFSFLLPSGWWRCLDLILPHLITLMLTYYCRTQWPRAGGGLTSNRQRHRCQETNYVGEKIIINVCGQDLLIEILGRRKAERQGGDKIVFRRN